MNSPLEGYTTQELELLLQTERAAFLNALDQNADIDDLQSIKIKIQQIYAALAEREKHN